MTQTISDGVKQAITNLARSGMAGTEIHRRLKDGSAGIGEPVTLTVRRVQQIAAQARRDGEPVDPLPEDTQALSVKHLKAILNAAFKNSRRLTTKKHPTSKDLEEMRKTATTIGTTQRELASISARSRNPQQAEAAQKPKHKSTLERLAELPDPDRPASRPPEAEPNVDGGHSERATRLAAVPEPTPAA